MKRFDKAIEESFKELDKQRSCRKIQQKIALIKPTKESLIVVKYLVSITFLWGSFER
jgi:hypothetical protein